MNEDKPERMPNTPPFVRFVCSAIPMVFDDSLSYYEALCALWKYVQGMTDVINNNATLEEEYILKFNELKTFVDTYFDNLDVQEEINNKLDQMAEDGELTPLIKLALNPDVTWTFDTVADMKASTNLVDGCFARTLGFHSVGDGGGALYKISDSGTADGMYVIACGSLYANLIIQDYITPEILGAYGDNTHDDTAAVQACLSNTNYPHKVLSKSYKITSGLTIPNYSFVDGGGSIHSTSSCFELDGIEKVTIRDLNLYPTTNAIHIFSTTRYSNYNLFENIYCYGSAADGSKGLFIEVTDHYINENTYRNLTLWNFAYGIYALNDAGIKEMNKHTFTECSTETSTVLGQYIKNGSIFSFINCRHVETGSNKWKTEGTCDKLFIEGGYLWLASNVSTIADFSATTNGQIINGLRYPGVSVSASNTNGVIVNGKVIPDSKQINNAYKAVNSDMTISYGDQLYTSFRFAGTGDAKTLTLDSSVYGSGSKISEFFVNLNYNSATYSVVIGDVTISFPASSAASKYYKVFCFMMGDTERWKMVEIS